MQIRPRRRLQSAGSSLAADAAVELVGIGKHFGSRSFVDLGAGDDPDDIVEDEDEDEDPGDGPALASGAVALDDVTLSIPRGTVFGIAGPHAAGKTTLVRLIAGTLVPTSGEVRVRGRVSPPPETLGRLLNPAADGAANVALLARLLGLQERVATLDLAGVFALAGLAGSERAPFGSLARRELSALLVAAVLQLQPDIYLFDPGPKIADPGVRAAIDELIAQRVQSGAVVVLTGEHADRLPADTVALLRRGRLVELRAPKAPERPVVDWSPAKVVDPPPATVVDPPLASHRAAEPKHQMPRHSDLPRQGLRLLRVDVDVRGRPATIRIVVEVPVARIDATFGFIFRTDGRNTAKQHSATYALTFGYYELVAYLGGLCGPRGASRVLVGVLLDHNDEEQSVAWPEPIDVDVGQGLDGATHTSWRLEAIDASDVVERSPVAAGEPAKAEHDSQQSQDAR